METDMTDISLDRFRLSARIQAIQAKRGNALRQVEVYGKGCHQALLFDHPAFLLSTLCRYRFRHLPSATLAVSSPFAENSPPCGTPRSISPPRFSNPIDEG